MANSGCCILILGWARPDFVCKRILELQGDSSLADFPIYVSIDGPKKDSTKVLLQFQSDKVLTFIQHKSNLGGAEHYFLMVDQLLKVYSAVVVVEDDVIIGKGSIKNLVDAYLELSHRISDGNSYIISGFSAFPVPASVSKFNLFFDSWYPARYFNCWGHLINREAFNQVLSVRRELSQISSEYESHADTEWSKLSPRQRKIWLDRARRGTYDYIIQFAILKRGITHLKPVFRRFDNEGIGNQLASHTKGKRNWRWGPISTVDSSQQNAIKIRNVRIMVQVLNFFDNLLMAQDSILTARGRKHGIRSSLKNLLSS